MSKKLKLNELNVKSFQVESSVKGGGVIYTDQLNTFEQICRILSWGPLACKER